MVKYGVLCWPRNIIVSCLREVVCPHVKCGAGPGWQDSLIYVLCVLESWYLVTQTLSSGAPLLLLIQRLRPFYSLLPSWHWHQLERTWRVFKSTEYKVEIDQPYNTSYTAKLLKWGLSLNFWFVCHCKKLSFYCYWFNTKRIIGCRHWFMTQLEYWRQIMTLTWFLHLIYPLPTSKLVWQAFITAAGGYSLQEGAEENVLITSCIRLFVELTILLQPRYLDETTQENSMLMIICRSLHNFWIWSLTWLLPFQISKSFLYLGEKWDFVLLKTK